MKKGMTILGIIVLAASLVLIRAFEDVLFYDPLLEFFKGDYKSMPLPQMDIVALQMGIVYRYLLNSIFSLGILWLAFKDLGVIQISSVLYLLLFLLFFAVFSLLLFTSENTSNHFMLFYVRRFLIQPLFLLILLPAFYFQKRKSY